MNRSNTTGKKFPNRHCVHGGCIGHEPEWKHVGIEHLEPNPWFFGKKTYWMSRCCGKSMARYKEVIKRQCKKCGRTEDCVINYDLALCLCCSKSINNSYDCD